MLNNSKCMSLRQQVHSAKQVQDNMICHNMKTTRHLVNHVWDKCRIMIWAQAPYATVGTRKHTFHSVNTHMQREPNSIWLMSSRKVCHSTSLTLSQYPECQPIHHAATILNTGCCFMNEKTNMRLHRIRCGVFLLGTLTVNRYWYIRRSNSNEKKHCFTVIDDTAFQIDCGTQGKQVNIPSRFISHCSLEGLTSGLLHIKVLQIHHGLPQ